MYTWQDAVDVAMTDPEINLQGGEGQVYTPSAYEDENEADWAKAEAEAETQPVDPTTTETKVEKDATR
jgi:large subunit ribosomal protein L47